jgi:hypothetical protein
LPKGGEGKEGEMMEKRFMVTVLRILNVLLWNQLKGDPHPETRKKQETLIEETRTLIAELKIK